MFRIRYYDKVIHPEHFRKGLLGLRIRALNWVRWKLEVHVQSLVLKYLSDEGDLPKERKVRLREMFKLDVEAEQLEAKATAPHVTQAVEAERINEPPVQEMVEVDKVAVRPRPIDDLAARYSAPPRERRYARGRHNYMVESDDAFEPVPAASDYPTIPKKRNTAAPAEHGRARE